MRNGWFAALAFAGAFGCYLLLAGSLSWTELGAAVPTAGAVAGFMTVQRLRPDRPVALMQPPARVLWATLRGLVMDTARVGLALLRAVVNPVGGEATWQAFRPGGHNPRDAGRRALTTLLTSLAPNGFVLDLRPSGLTEADHGLLLHRLVPAPPLSDADWPA